MELGSRSFLAGGVITKIFSNIHLDVTATTFAYYIIRIYTYIVHKVQSFPSGGGRFDIPAASQLKRGNTGVPMINIKIDIKRSMCQNI